MIRALAGGGVTVLLTTQYLEEADVLAGHICVIDHGKVIADGTLADLKRVIIGQAVVVRPRRFSTGVRAGVRLLCRIDGNRAAVGHEYMVSKHRGGVRRRPGSGSSQGKGRR